MASAALQAFRRTVTVTWPKGRELEAKVHLLKVARDGHAEIMRKQGNPAFTAYANTPGNSNLDSVVPPGPIVFEYSSIREIIEFALDALRKASPVTSGDYVRSHMIYVNGMPAETLPESIKPTDEVMIANPVPYARRIEIGKTKAGRDFVIQVENRIYERVAKKMVASRYRSMAKISFGYVSIPNAHQLQRAPRKRRKRLGERVRAPAIFIEALT